MAKLSEVLGGLLRDVTQARVSADMLARDTWREYQRDPLLAQFPSPRLTLRDVNVTLRFAVAGQAEPALDDADLGAVRKEWLDTLATEVVPAAYGDDDRPPDRQLQRRLAAAVASEEVDEAVLREALAGEREPLVGASVQAVAAAKARLSSSEQPRLPNLRVVRARAQPLIAERVDLFLERARKQLEARTSAAALDVVVTERELAEIAPERIQELTFTIAADDVIATTPPAGERGEDDRGGD